MNYNKWSVLFIYTVCMFYIALYLYAGVSKLLDYQDFKIQIGQSPILSIFADWIAWAVPVFEFLIAGLLFFLPFRRFGLLIAVSLMVMFTSYIVIILQYSSFIPCSCGGILSRMSWGAHLTFNIVVVLLGLTALALQYTTERRRFVVFFVHVFLSGGTAILLVTVLFIVSESRMGTSNPFVRRFPSHTQPEFAKIDMGYGSYYFAGVSGSSIYLGNATTPLYVTIVDTLLKSTKKVHIAINPKLKAFTNPRLQVRAPYFFLTDGAQSCVYRGRIDDWRAGRIQAEWPFFTACEVLDSTTLALRLTHLKRKNNSIAVYSVANGQKRSYPLLENSKSVFDSDGLMVSDSEDAGLYYTFYYRNQYLKIDYTLDRMQTNSTIDTMRHSSVRIAENSSGQLTLAAPPTIINRTSAAYDSNLYILSPRKGKFEDRGMYRHASVIDVYSTRRDSYLGSFYLYDLEGEKVREFIISGHTLYQLCGDYLAAVKLPDYFYTKP